MSETPAETPTPEAPAAVPPPAETPTPDKGAEKDWQAEAEKWKTFARKHEDAAKANADKAKRFDEFEESQKTEQQKLADKLAAAEARAAELEVKTLRAEVAADKGIPASLLSGSTLEELTASADALVAFRGEKPKPDLGGGDRGADVGGKGGQITSREALQSMTPEEINQARLDGRLNTLLGIKT
jgi:hypothetical protein